MVRCKGETQRAFRLKLAVWGDEVHVWGLKGVVCWELDTAVVDPARKWSI